MSWMDDAKCREHDADVFFPLHIGEVRRAISICESCSVRVECLEYAIEEEIEFGVWGGLSERSRRVLIKERRSASRQKLKKVK